MNSEAQAAFVRELVGISSESTRDPVDDFSPGISWESGDQILTLPEPIAFMFFSLSGKLTQQPPWSDRVSEEYVKTRLVPILMCARDSGTAAASKLSEELVKDVENYSVERTVYIPTDNLVLERVAKPFGGSRVDFPQGRSYERQGNGVGSPLGTDQASRARIRSTPPVFGCTGEVVLVPWL